eukprot:1980748-Pyramimonas_sp.AAC.1
MSNPALLYHAERHMQAEVHGDDFGMIMRRSQEGWFDDALSRCDFKVAGIPSSKPLSGVPQPGVRLESCRAFGAPRGGRLALDE